MKRAPFRQSVPTHFIMSWVDIRNRSSVAGSKENDPLSRLRDAIVRCVVEIESGLISACFKNGQNMQECSARSLIGDHPGAIRARSLCGRCTSGADNMPRTFSKIAYLGRSPAIKSMKCRNTLPRSSFRPNLLPAVENAWQGGPPTIAKSSSVWIPKSSRRIEADSSLASFW